MAAWTGRGGEGLPGPLDDEKKPDFSWVVGLMRVQRDLARFETVFCVDLTRADYHPREEGLRIIADETGGFYGSALWSIGDQFV
jgi:hypothetical protein